GNANREPSTVYRSPSTAYRVPLTAYRCMMDAVIQVDSIRKAYGAKVAVDDISFDVCQGEIFGLIGPNGAGKTTTLECVEGLRTPDRGTVSVLGLDPIRDAYA